MIGVTCPPDDMPIVEEFFELFKVDWERAEPGRRYSAVLSAGGSIDGLEAHSFLIYGSSLQPLDTVRDPVPRTGTGPKAVNWKGTSFPIYGSLAAFDSSDGMLKHGPKRVDYGASTPAGRVHRVGYDLFSEVRHLLTEGQPAQWAAIPTLELHIDLLRHLLLRFSAGFVEIPPRPGRYEFVCCLTHDVDFCGIRRHVLDRTLFGFVARGSLGSLIDVFRRRRSIRDAVRNWIALLSLPLVFAQILPDPWRPFEAYAAADKARRATYFIVPFRNRPGVSPEGKVARDRAVAYEASDLQTVARRALADGNEIALHGIDAWRDAKVANAESAAILALTGAEQLGVRMHWLYYASRSPHELDRAGFDYDSSWGYNDAVGYRAGTAQAFRPPGTARLLELPLTIMDSALFFRDRMGLTAAEALTHCRQFIHNARRFGGALVINWHDRSLAPERLWGEPYAQLLACVEGGCSVWFATASEAVAWFRWRRSIRFTVNGAGQTVITAGPRRGVPAARMTAYGPHTPRSFPVDGDTPLAVQL